MCAVSNPLLAVGPEGLLLTPLCPPPPWLCLWLQVENFRALVTGEKGVGKARVPLSSRAAPSTAS